MLVSTQVGGNHINYSIYFQTDIYCSCFGVFFLFGGEGEQVHASTIIRHILNSLKIQDPGGQGKKSLLYVQRGINNKSLITLQIHKHFIS